MHSPPKSLPAADDAATAPAGMRGGVVLLVKGSAAFICCNMWTIAALLIDGGGLRFWLAVGMALLMGVMAVLTDRERARLLS